MPGFKIDKELIRDLAELLKETDLNEIEIVEGERKIRVARKTAHEVHAIPASLPPSAPSNGGPAASAAPAPAPQAGGIEPGTLTSPMVGTVYTAPEPGTAPFVKVGDAVSEGQTLLIVEAMKTMNPIVAPKSGTIAQILIADGQPVEFGEPLMIIR